MGATRLPTICRDISLRCPPTTTHHHSHSRTSMPKSSAAVLHRGQNCIKTIDSSGQRDFQQFVETSHCDALPPPHTTTAIAEPQCPSLRRLYCTVARTASKQLIHRGNAIFNNLSRHLTAMPSHHHTPPQP